MDKVEAFQKLMALIDSGAIIFRDPPCYFCGEPVTVGTAQTHCPEATAYSRRAAEFLGLRAPAED